MERCYCLAMVLAVASWCGADIESSGFATTPAGAITMLPAIYSLRIGSGTDIDSPAFATTPPAESPAFATTPPGATAWIPATYSLGIGYSHIDVGGSSSPLHSMDALRFDNCVSFSPIGKLPPLRLGAAFGVSSVLSNTSGVIISNDGNLFIAGSGEVTFIMLEPEVRLRLRQ